jgi:two-component system OmpR family sensor kinase
MPLSFKARLSLWHMVLVALVLAAAALVANWTFARLVGGQVDAALVELANIEAGTIAANPGRPVRIHEAPPGTTPPSFVRLDKFLQIATLDGEVVARSATLGTAHLPTPALVLDRVGQGQVVFETVEDFGEEPIRMVSVPLIVGGRHYAIQVATSLDDARAVIRAARWLFVLVSVAILTAVVVTGARLARRALRPIDEMVKRARRIGETNLAERLPHPGGQDEIGRLVETLNEMLGRIEQSFEAQRRFTADASHELRSPLSRLRAELEVTLRRPREPAEYQQALSSCLEEVERLSSLTEELLSLARLDAGEAHHMPTEPTPLLPLVELALRRLGPEAGRRGVTLTLAPAEPVLVRAAPSAATLAVANVLDNAVKFSRSGGQVTVGVAKADRDAIISVHDSGPGVAPGDIARLFERFHRGSAARSPDTPGVGLGLAISRALLEGQGGHIGVENHRDEGAVFTIRLPLAT